jgi:hypothetical protein
MSRFFSALVSACFLTSTLVAATPNPAQTTTAAGTLNPSTVLQNSLAVLVGTAALSDVTLTGTARRIVGSTDETGTVTFRALPTGEMRYDFSYPSGVWSEIHEGIAAGPLGSWSGPDGVAHPIALHNLANRSDIFPAFSLSPLLSSPNMMINLIGPETKNGQSVYHVAVSQQFPQLPPRSASLAQHLSQTDLFLDATTLLPVAVDFNTHPDDNSSLDIPVELLFSDYRSVSGSQIPFHVQKFLNNGLGLDLQFSSASINSGLAVSTFRVQ